jgi:hypothetical protein
MDEEDPEEDTTSSKVSIHAFNIKIAAFDYIILVFLLPMQVYLHPRNLHQS